MDRRQFLQSSLYASLLYGAGGIPNIINEASAAFAPVQNRFLVNLFLNGGVDFRHLIVPAYNSNPNSFGNKYWKHRWTAHDLSETNQSAWQARWENDYYPITVGGQHWSGGLVDAGNKNSGITFGIWREAGWLIKMFQNGEAALICNAVGGRNRAHDLSTLMLNQGNVLSGLNNADRSGWGGRLARSSGGNIISVTNSVSSFCFGPQGSSPGYNPNAIDNRDLIAVQNSREMGLNDYRLTENQRNRPNQKLARALKNYYAALRSEQIGKAYQKFTDHEFKVREFGRLIDQRLNDLPVPQLIEALYNEVSIDGVPQNPAPGTSDARRILRNSYSWGPQIRNLYDCLACNDLLGLRAVSMEYGGWDSHADQRQNAGESDVDNPQLNRGIENGFKDIFGGPFSGDPTAWHSGFSALWESLAPVDRNKMVLTVAGEFGRQIRSNRDGGTDHGKGNIMMVIGNGVRGGIYGEMFQADEIDKYDDESLNTPDIDPRTDIDYFLARVCDWVTPNSGNIIFPRLTNGGLPEEDRPIIEPGVSFQNLLA